METADLTITLKESVFFNGIYRDSQVTQVIQNVTGVDNKILSLYSGSTVELVRFSSSLDSIPAGVINPAKLAYFRATNLDTGSVYLNVAGDVSGSATFKLDQNDCFILNSTVFSSSIENVQSIKATSSQTNSIEYFIATT